MGELIQALMTDVGGMYCVLYLLLKPNTEYTERRSIDGKLITVLVATMMQQWKRETNNSLNYL